MCAISSIWKIIWWNLRRVYLGVQTARVKIIFPLAARLGGIYQHWLVLANFGETVGGKLHQLVTLWVWVIIRCEKRQKVLSEILYKAQKLFSPGGPHGGIPPNLGQNLGVFPHVDRQGKNLTRYLLAFLASNYLWNSQRYELMKFTSHSVSKIG